MLRGLTEGAGAVEELERVDVDVEACDEEIDEMLEEEGLLTDALEDGVRDALEDGASDALEDAAKDAIEDLLAEALEDERGDALEGAAEDAIEDEAEGRTEEAIEDEEACSEEELAGIDDDTGVADEAEEREDFDAEAAVEENNGDELAEGAVALNTERRPPAPQISLLPAQVMLQSESATSAPVPAVNALEQ